MKELGEYLKKTRISNGVSLEEAAEDLELSASQLENIENGKEKTHELDIDELREELGLEEETEDEKKLRKENFQKMCEKNDEENRKIFGENYSRIFKN